MANRANRQNVIFVIEKIENPIITDSETKFLRPFSRFADAGNGSCSKARIARPIRCPILLESLPILFRQYAQRRCATSCIDLQIAEYFVNGAYRLIASVGDRH